MNHYLKAFLALSLLFLLSLGGSVFGALHYRATRERRLELERTVLEIERRVEATGRDYTRRVASAPPASLLLQSWAPALSLCQEKSDTAFAMRGGLESLAQLKLGLVTDQFLAPEPVRVSAGGGALWVQRVSLRATGERLSSLLVWLGEAEALYPLARVEGVELLAGPSGNESLKLNLAHPVSRQNTVFPE